MSPEKTESKKAKDSDEKKPKAEEKKVIKPTDIKEKTSERGESRPKTAAKEGKKDSNKDADESAKGDDVEIVEPTEEAFKSKQRPEGADEIRSRLKLRAKISARRPTFRRQEGHRYKRLDTGWRKPRGSHSKMRRHYKYRGRVVSIGYGSPADTKHLHPSGFKEVLVNNPRELECINAALEAARIAHGVGIRKRFDIEKRADELGIRVLNRS